MPLPKKRHSSTRRDKRRSANSKIKPVFPVLCKNTGVFHRSHHGYIYRGDLYVKGKIVIKGYTNS